MTSAPFYYSVVEIKKRTLQIQLQIGTYNYTKYTKGFPTFFVFVIIKIIYIYIYYLNPGKRMVYLSINDIYTSD